MKNNMLRNLTQKIGVCLLSASLVFSFLPDTSMQVLAAKQSESLTKTDEEAKNLGEEAGDEIEEHEYTTVRISTAEELVDYLSKCTSDSFSRYTIVEIENDINLSSINFVSAEIFAGTFHGNNHTLNGIHRVGGGYADGFFRYLSESAYVEGINIYGYFEADNDKIMTGGIAGVNAGTIHNCTFVGIVSGKSETGGIAGENESTGVISNCKSFGTVTGYNMAGGIVGANYGQIVSCENEAAINADNSWVNASDEDGYSWVTDSVEDKKLVNGTDIGGIAGLSHGTIINSINKGNVGYNHNGYNIGGIAGRQSGQIIYCTNKGQISGRKDVGGIVGQMEPYISIEDAESISEAAQDLHDKIDVFLNHAGKSSDDLTSDLDRLRAYSDDAVDSAHTISNGVTSFMDSNVAAVGNLSNKIQYLADQMPDIISETIVAVDRMKVAAEDFRKVSAILAQYGKNVNNDYNKQYEVSNSTVTLVTSVGGVMDVDDSTPNPYETVTVNLRAADGYQQNGISIVDSEGNAVPFNDESVGGSNNGKYTFTMPDGGKTVTICGNFARTSAAKTYGDSNYSDVYVESNPGGTAVSTKKSGVADDIYTIAITPQSGYIIGSVVAIDNKGTGTTLDSNRVSQINTLQYEINITDGLTDIDGNALANVTKPVQVMVSFAKDPSGSSSSGNSSSNMTGYISQDVETLQSQMNDINDTTTQIENIMNGRKYNDLTPAEQREIDALVTTLITQVSRATKTSAALTSEMTQAGALIARDTEVALNDSNAAVQVVITDLEGVFDSLNGVFSRTKSAISYANDMPDATFTNLDNKTKQSVEDLYSQLGSISSATGSLTSNLSTNSDVLEADMHGINDQINKIMQLFSSMIEDAEDLYNDESLYEDVSDELIDMTSDGKVDACTNAGYVCGDIDVGGIAGSMAIDEEDPEGNAAGEVTYSLGARYLTKCIITNCTNNADVSSKKDGAGGISGYMNLGIISDSQSYGKVESTEGSYVGGISGQSLALIRNSYALTDLHGSKYVGGIAGTGSKIKDCLAMVTIENESDQRGAIAGMIEGDPGDRFGYVDNINNNYFVSDSVGGIDGMSLEGIAEAKTYQELIATEGIPTKFRHLSIKFFADDKLVDTMEVPYGTDLSTISMPEVPDKGDGTYGVWPDISDKKMEVNMVLEAEYADTITTLESNAKDENSKRNYVYIDGDYTNSAEIVVNTEQDDKKNTITYTIYVDGTTLPIDKVSKVRIYNPYENIKSVECKDAEGNWKSVEYKEYGSYLQVEMQGMDAVYRITGKEEVNPKVYVIGGSVAGLGVLATLIAIIKKKKKHKKADK